MRFLASGIIALLLLMLSGCSAPPLQSRELKSETVPASLVQTSSTPVVLNEELTNGDILELLVQAWADQGETEKRMQLLRERLRDGQDVQSAE